MSEELKRRLIKDLVALFSLVETRTKKGFVRKKLDKDEIVIILFTIFPETRKYILPHRVS